MKKLLAVFFATLLCVVGVVGFSGCKKEQETLVVYTESGFAPFEYVSGGKIVGVDVEIMEKVGQRLNKKIVFENVAFSTIIDAVAAGRLTNVGAAGISINEERAQKVDFSKEYYTAALYVIYKADQATTYESNTSDNVKGVYWDTLAGKNIAVQSGTTADLFLGDELAEGGILFGTEAERTGFDKLAIAVEDIGMNSDVLIIDELPAKQLIAGKADLACAPLYYKGENNDDEAAIDTYAIAVTKGQTELLNAINEVLDELGEAGIQALVNKHLGLNG